MSLLKTFPFDLPFAVRYDVAAQFKLVLVALIVNQGIVI